jgi:DnaJ like chaperone protein
MAQRIEDPSGSSWVSRMAWWGVIFGVLGSAVLCCGGSFGYAVAALAGAGVLSVVSFVAAGGSQNPALHGSVELPSSLSAGDARRVRFVEAVVRLSVHVGLADGTFDAAEQRAILRFFGASEGPMREWVRAVLHAELRGPNLSEALMSATMLAEDESERVLVVLALATVAGADGKLDPREVQVIVGIAHALGFEAAYALALILVALGVEVNADDPREAGLSRDEAAQVLGVGATATAAEVQAAWKVEARKHHPDRAAHLGPEFVRLAEERMKRLNQARDVLLAPPRRP